MIDLTVPEIKRKLQQAGPEEFAALERSLVADTRKGVIAALEVARRRIAAEDAERLRVEGMFAFERELAKERGAKVIVGLDEVGRGPLAGPLAVGAVVLPEGAFIAGLNDSKQLTHEAREDIALEVKRLACAWSVQFVEPHAIDSAGMTASLLAAFRRALADVEAQGPAVDLVLLDGNPLKMDKRELNVVKGDAKCASIAAASVIAKVARDALMVELDGLYPGYGFAANKGYASPEHIEAIKQRGISPVHRASFCTAFTQPSLF